MEHMPRVACAAETEKGAALTPEELELVSVDVSLAAKDKGVEFFKAIAPSLNAAPTQS